MAPSHPRRRFRARRFRTRVVATPAESGEAVLRDTRAALTKVVTVDSLAEGWA